MHLQESHPTTEQEHVIALSATVRWCQAMLAAAGPPFEAERFPYVPEEYAQLGPAEKQLRKQELYANARRLIEVLERPLPRDCYPFDIERLVQFPEQQPVFVLGGPRAGTTVVAAGLRAVGSWFGWQEGHLFSVLPALLMAFTRSWAHALTFQHQARTGTALGTLDNYAIMNAVVARCHAVYSEAVAQQGAVRWLDKSPSIHGTLVVPLLRRIYPRARYIFLHRHPLKQVLSFRRKFSGKSLEWAAFYCLLSLKAWPAVRPFLEAGTFVEVAQADLRLRTDETVARLASLLELDAEQAARLRTYFRARRPESTGSCGDSADICLDRLNWPEPFTTWYRDLAEATARQWGYRLDGHC
jgi:hypothetical protein